MQKQSQLNMCVTEINDLLNFAIGFISMGFILYYQWKLAGKDKQITDLQAQLTTVTKSESPESD
ncbi:MAG: hypothetical protein KA716_31835 [Gloeotrichia echinulata DEX184]|nr:hypothetical protein [Gloeotrichia echinulata DEX184]MCM0594527.1 hypothetical protein [Gloeotrichia echinulata DEX184]